MIFANVHKNSRVQYIYTLADDKFTVNHPTDLGNGMTFTLIETLAKNRLEVMELLEKNGKKLTPYETPIIYERVGEWAKFSELRRRKNSVFSV